MIASLSQLVPDPEPRTAYNQELAEPYPPGSDAEGLAEALSASERGVALQEVLQDGEDLGLNLDEILARLEAGGTKNHGLAQEWVERDLTAILAKDGIEIEKATTEQMDDAVETLDAFQMRLASELGVEIESAFEDLEQGQLVQDQGIIDAGNITNAGSIVHAGDIAQLEGLDAGNAYIRQLAQNLRGGGLSDDQQDIMQRTLVTELHNELGDEGMAELDRGHWQVLDAVLPNKVDQISVTKEYLEIAAEDRGEPELAEIASDLTQARANERAKEISAEKAVENTSGSTRDRGLDDDIGL